MFDHQLNCAACGEKLSAAASACPRCGALRSVAVTDEAQAAGVGAPSEKAEAEPSTPPPQSPRAPGNQVAKPQPGAVPAFYLAPADTDRRSWRLCPAQLKKIGLVALAVVLAVGLGVAWRWNVKDTEMRRLAELRRAMEREQQAEQQSAALPEAPVPLPTAPPVDDQTLTANVRLALTGYNVLGAAIKYKYEVKDGVVTLGGEADNQAEKDGVENVVKSVTGVKGVVNTMAVKNTAPGDLVKFMPGAGLSPAESKRLEEILNKEQGENARRAEEERRKQAETDTARAAEQEADRQRREQAAAKLREEEAALRKQAEERLRQEAAEFERRQDEQRRAEAARRARAEQAKLEASVLRTGTVAWSGVVEGVDEVVISGASASVRHVSGEPVREAKASFSAAVPRAPVTVKLLSSSGRAPVKIVQEPSSANGYTTIVRVGDGEKGGGKRHEFTLKWSAQ
jgi:Skp family chaperone for outer membrane proteins/flagellar basal body-associated protein FliL